MFNVVNSSNGITVERNKKGIFKVSGGFKVPFDELSKEEQKSILKLISESKMLESKFQSELKNKKDLDSRQKHTL